MLKTLFFTAVSLSFIQGQVTSKFNITFFGKFPVFFDVIKDAQNKPMIHYTVDIPKDTYLAFVYGSSMVNTDMVAFVADSQGVSIQDLWSTGYYTPSQDSSNHYQATFTSQANGYKAQGSRLLSTGDSQDFSIPIGEMIQMTAVYADAGFIVPHGSNIQLFTMKVAEDGNGGYLVTGQDQGSLVKVAVTLIHGWLFWVAWAVFGFVQFISARYMKPWWKVNMWIHRISGSLILCLTISMGIIGIMQVGWELSGKEAHYVIGLIIFFSVLFIALGGIYARSRARRIEWNTKDVINRQVGHKMAGRLLITLSVIQILLGVDVYNRLHAIKESPLGIINICVFFGLVIIAEVSFQVYKFKEAKSFKVPESIKKLTIDEFNHQVKIENQKLVLLDDLVLNIADFMDNHPGGRFALEHNIGRDISKFFYGGYALDGNLARGQAVQHVHSNVARTIVESLIVGRLVPNDKVSDSAPVYEARVKSRHSVNKLTNTLELEITDPSQMTKTSWPRRFYSDIQMIGRHYLINEVGKHKVKRHYTVANCMSEKSYSYYKQLLHSAKSGEKPSDFNQVIQEDGSSFTITTKNYGFRNGLSTRLNTAELNTLYKVQGPMGKGLGIKKEGTHIAFTAGTGCLVFVDLVAHLLRKNMKLLSSGEDEQLSSNFKFVFYVSFPNKEEAIAYELCKGLEELTISKGLNNYQFCPRFTNESKGRWDADFINKTLQTYENIQKVWVCGPPAMNELFDKHFTKSKPTFAYEIL